MAEDVVAVGIEAHAPETHTGHELLRLLKLTVATEDGIDKFTAAVLAHGNRLLLAILLLGSLPHVVLADLEEFHKADPEALAALEEVFDHFVALLLADLGDGLFGPLDFAGQLYEEEPQFASHLSERGCWAVVEDGPVVDPFAKGVGIKDGSEKHDGFFVGVPVLVRVAGRDASATCILFGGLGTWLGGRWLLWRGGLGTSGG